MADDELYIGPTRLAPGAKEPSDAGERLARKILIPLVVVFLVLLVVFYVLFDFGRVTGPSMYPTLREGDRALMTKGYPTPNRGDIVFTRVDERGTPVELVKRVIAVPGDTVEIRDDTAIVNGVPEPQRGQVVIPAAGGSAPPLTVPPGQLYVMGDNRAVSYDSRYLGTVPLSGVRGKVFFIYAPVTRMGPVR